MDLEINETTLEGNGKEVVDKAEEIDGQSYPILGTEIFEQPKKLEAVRPNWIRKSTSVSAKLDADTTPAVENMPELNAELFSEIFADEGVKFWFPVQKEVIPELLRDIRVPRNLPPRDLCISAPTGSGKTLCYVLPIIQGLCDRTESKIRALVMLPVKVLAQQVFRVFSTFAAKTNLSIFLLGQKDFETEEKLMLEQVPDILISTPGRLMDHFWAKHRNKTVGHGEAYLDLRFLRYLVIDEADRMMADCRFDWLTEVEAAVYGEESPNIYRSKAGSLSMRRLQSVRIPLRKILLSATLSSDPEQLQQWNLFQPKLFAATFTDEKRRSLSNAVDQSATDTVTSLGVPAELAQRHLICAGNLKPLNLHILLQSHAEEWKKVLCFVDSKENGKRLVGILKLMKTSGVVAEIDANLMGGRREKVLKKFAGGKIRVLVCSDLVARGMDIADIDCVISYNPPKLLKTYVHRVGRTARAGRPGTAVTILEENEVCNFGVGINYVKVENLKEVLGPVCDWSVVKAMDVSSEKISELRPAYKAALKQLKDQITEAKKHGKPSKQGPRRKR